MSEADGIADALARVTAATQAVKDAELERLLVVREAWQAGATVVAIADAAGVSRPAIYRILNEERIPLPPKTQWRDILTDALQILALQGSEQAAGALKHGLPAETLARRLINGFKQVSEVPGGGQRDRLLLASDIAHEIEQLAKAGKRVQI